MGRHSTYTEETAEIIIEKLTIGIPLRQICRSAEMPSASTVTEWVSNRPEFAVRYARARTLGLDALAEEILDISDDASNDWMEREKDDGRLETVLNSEHINRSKLRVDARKWLLSKMRPDKYGDRVAIAGDKDAPLELNIGSVELLTSRIDSLIARSGADKPTQEPE